MTDSLYLLGAPGVGKSTVMAGVLDELALAVNPDNARIHKRLTGHGLYDTLSGDTRGVYLGKMREEFPGTDGLSMAVAPDAREWAGRLSRTNEGGMQYVVGEGMRLGNPGFLSALAEHSWLTVILLTASEDALTARRDARGSTQTPSWMRGAATSARNAYAAARTTAPVNRALEFDTTDVDPEHIAREIAGLLG
jgi:broad-specificity NMP kinase